MLCGSGSCNAGYSGPVDTITIATMANPGDTLIFVAENEQYFTRNGLNIVLKTYTNGLLATDAMLSGEADLAYATEFVLVGKALEGQPLSIVAAYSTNNTVAIAGLKDRGMNGIADLKGKKIGLARGTVNEFYLVRILNLNRIGLEEVTLVDVSLAGLTEALNSGMVDAVVAGSKNLYPVLNQPGNDIFLWPAHSGQPAFGILSGRNDWLADHTEPLTRLMKSLTQAEDYVSQNADSAMHIVQTRLKFDDGYMAMVWEEYEFSLSLGQPMILAMEDEARWMLNSSLVTPQPVPNFLDFVFVDCLKSVRPGAVSMAGRWD
jgi:NitT/TauT family transport system substrate-binding protein